MYPVKLPLSDLPALGGPAPGPDGSKEKTWPRQLDSEVLCVCQRLSLAKYPFTASKVDAYLLQSDFLPHLHESSNSLMEKGYSKVVAHGKPFRPESEEMTFKEGSLVGRCTGEMRRLPGQRDVKLAGRAKLRPW